ncbi:beta-glucosidase [Brachionus plicatilis]|uniref:beta-glucosidase n=1 Tax=Brachionus plicatilis TaxID=10195 RepID=A0A3M7T3Q5_BRAPC|nr:beta-glucosidase [Brachionus plicatilis]
MLKYTLIFMCLSFTPCKAIDIDKLLSSMNYEEKCGQMTQVVFDVVQNSPQPTDFDVNPVNLTKLEYAIKQKHIGSILNTPYYLAQKASTWQKVISSIQDTSLQTRLKIPVIYGLDSIHGANYVQEAVLFPHSISLGGSFNLDLIAKIAHTISLETRAVGIPWNFNPVLDVGRQPLWPRIFETFGEDAYLVGKMGEAYIQGSHGNDLKNRSNIATCLKHYVGYSLPFNGRDRTPAYIPENLLREVFLPPFEKGVLAGSSTVMVNSAEVNGIPGHANYHYLTEILKGELKFSGFVVSDWGDIVQLKYRDKFVESDEEAVRVAVMAGLDMSMARVDDATRRILKVKNDLGLFEDAYPFPEDLAKIGAMESHDLSLEAARESIVLAQNDGTLPLNLNRKILIAGPSGSVLRVLNGGWSYVWQGNVESYFNDFGTQKKTTIFEEVKKIKENTEYSQGANFTHLTNLEETLNKAKSVDIIILTIGEDSYCEIPGNINNLMLSEAQQKLSERLLELGKPIVLVYIGGRPRIITKIAQKSNAVLIGFLPGEKGSQAIAEIIFGKYNPNAKLSVTYPLDANGFSTYDYKPLEVHDTNKVQMLYGFGHGLSYTHFEYLNLKLSKKIVSFEESLTVSVTVKNSGQMDGKESVLLFLNDEYASVTRPVRKLKGFKKSGRAWDI